MVLRRAKLWPDEQKPHIGCKRWVRLHSKPKPNSCTESLRVDMAGIRGKERVSTRGGLMDMGIFFLRTMVETRFAMRSQMNPQYRASRRAREGRNPWRW